MIPEAELRLQRRVTRAFIEADIETIVLERRVRQEDGAGGSRIVSAGFLAPQEMRLIPSTSRAQQERTTLDGTLVQPTFVLLGEHDAEMEIGDRFSLSGREFEVTYVHEKRDYQTKGEVFQRG